MKLTHRGALMSVPELADPLPGLFIPRGILFAQRVVGLWHVWLRGLLPTPVLGNPLHEAWSADGEPLERMTPDALAKSNSTRYLILPTNRGQ